MLRCPKWAEGQLPAAAGCPTPAADTSPVADLVRHLTNQRLYREVSLTLKQAMRDAKAEFPFIRIKGLKSLIKFLTSAAKSEKFTQLFNESQSYTELQVVPVVFENTLSPPKRTFELPSDPISCEEPPQVVSSPSDREVTLALRVLEGCCIIDGASRFLASQFMAVKVILDLVLAVPIQQIACLDALLALMMDSPINQKEFERMDGLRKVAHLLKDVAVEEETRLRCAEFLLLLVHQVLPSGGTSSTLGVYGPDSSTLMKTAEEAKQELVHCLGDGCGSVLEASERSEPASADFADQHFWLQAEAAELLSAV
eukprot:TRINITY_DN4749_c0_g2_i2.p1 TRINITY_DN4749_c0_g2~~TRINITY_DN4749_c0_g2_i2.p1  ORF type:complete len:312 (+),score=53.82 TRINITY_DN4749_c0_g2_i2:134-1069(+)